MSRPRSTLHTRKDIGSYFVKMCQKEKKCIFFSVVKGFYFHTIHVQINDQTYDTKYKQFTVKPVLIANQKEDLKLAFKTEYRIMQAEGIAECSYEHSAILSTCIELPFVVTTFVLSIEWPLKTGFTVFVSNKIAHCQWIWCLLFYGCYFFK